MIGRRLGIVVAGALVSAGALAATAAPSSASPTHVAVVVSYPGTTAQVACVSWHSGMTGLDALGAAFTVGYDTRSGGAFVTTINGNPSSGFHDLTHYWSYWRNGGTGWSYSGTGAGQTHPSAGTVEGWSYDNGAQSAPAPPSISYATICAGQDPVTVPNSTPASSAPRPTHSVAGTTASAPAQASADAAATTTGTAPARGTTSTHRTSATTAALWSSTVAASSGAVTSPNASAVQFVRAGKKHSSSGTPVGALIGLGIALVIGVVAFVRLRGRRGTASG